MPVLRADVEATLALHPPAPLRLVLEAAGIGAGDATSSRELAARIASSLWWHHTSPLGWLADAAAGSGPPALDSARITLDDIVGHAARALGVEHAVDPNGDGWAQLHQLTHAMFRVAPLGGVALGDLDEHTRARLQPRWMPTLGLGFGSGGSVGAAWASGRALGFLKGPIGRLLPLIPPVAPYYRLLVSSLGTLRLVAWPVGVALGVLSLNQALGANQRKLVPLLLGVGALGPRPVREAELVDPGPDPR